MPLSILLPLFLCFCWSAPGRPCVPAVLVVGLACECAVERLHAWCVRISCRRLAFDACGAHVVRLRCACVSLWVLRAPALLLSRVPCCLVEELLHCTSLLSLARHFIAVPCGSFCVRTFLARDAGWDAWDAPAFNACAVRCEPCTPCECVGWVTNTVGAYLPHQRVWQHCD